MREAVTFVLFIAAVYGLANAIAVLKIGRFIFGVGYCPTENCTAPGHPHELRKWIGRIPYLGDLFYCPPCLAFWIGMAMSAWIFSPAAPFVKETWQYVLIDGLAASGVVWMLHLRAEVMRQAAGDL